MNKQGNSLLLSASDLMSFAGCRHLTELERRKVLGEIDPPEWAPPFVQMLRDKGEKHEEAYIEKLRLGGLDVMECSEHNRSVDLTLKAMMEGHDIITQAYLKDGDFHGYADILRKVEGKSKLGNYHYVVEDTKLAQETKATTILQLCLYTEMVSKLQGEQGKLMYVVKPGEEFPTDTFRYADFSAYYQRLKEDFLMVLADGKQDTYPMPVPKCDICSWWQVCNKKWKEDDHLSLVAGAGNQQIREIERRGFQTLEAWAEAPEDVVAETPKSGSLETYEKLHYQADIQLRGRRQKKMLHELLSFDEKEGLNRLPEPSPGDVYFDIEGDRYFEGEGIEYLFGYAVMDQNRELHYSAIWAKNREEEKAMFEKFMDFLMNQWEKYPGFHIYHYAPYEPTAFNHLASKYATREEEKDRLLRAGRFVDLYSVLKQSIRASVTSYSLKETEKLAGFFRDAKLLQDASSARRSISAAFETGRISDFTEEEYRLIEEYNKDDVVATEYVHRLLEEEYQKHKQELRLTRPGLIEGEPSKGLSERLENMRQVYEMLVRDLPESMSNLTKEESIKWLLANQIHFFLRENNYKFRDLMTRLQQDDKELLSDRKAVAYPRFVSQFVNERDRNPTHVYSFDNQEVDLSIGDSLVDRIIDYDNNKQIKPFTIGKVDAFDPFKGELRIKTTGASKDHIPAVIVKGETRNNDNRENSFIQVASELANDGITNNKKLKPICDLLLGRNPDYDLNEESYSSSLDRTISIAVSLNNSYLPIQGPPGSGKTYTGASVILELVKRGKRIGLTALSHAAIRNLIDKIIELGREKGVEIRIAQKPKRVEEELPEELEHIDNNQRVLTKLDDGYIVGGTTYLWSHDDAIDKLDYLFIDEAGQLSLTAVVAAARCAKNLVLLGDPQQLEQPTQASHPENSGISAMNYILGDHKTLPEGRGVFLDITYRLPESITKFTSDLYYENRLAPLDSLSHQQINGDGPFSGTGLYYYASSHIENESSSPEEVEDVKHLYSQILSSNLTWTDRETITRKISSDDILIMAPYNSQVNSIKRELPEARVGTVDKFQGQEAPIVIYSMTSSSAEDAPRGIPFLYDPHRLNVATSRAQCISILIASPRLFEAECHSIEQMRMVNGLCRYRELAEELVLH